jgi:NADP-dependent 3-hydroxy acid dehydrogenase YdfG
MVAIHTITESNVRIAGSLPAGLVAVFAGATSGIGESTLRQFTKRAQKPRIYFLGRRENEGQRVQAELKALNPGGEYHYVENDSSLLGNVDQACQYIREREPAINLLFLSCGTLITGKRKVPSVCAPAYYGHLYLPCPRNQ